MSITEQVSVSEASTETVQTKGKFKNSSDYRVVIVWRNVILMAYLHLAALYGVYLCFTTAKWQSIVFAVVLHYIACWGITAGAHRLWSHKTYKAKLPLKIILAVCQSMAFQNSIYEWSRDHRVHHKYSETHADPHNALRGFFFSHIGWLLCRKHPDVIEKGRKIDLSDLHEDPVVMFQKKHYLLSVAIFCFIIPALIPCYFWGESFLVSFVVCSLMRYCSSLNSTWLVNSAAHMWGQKPYDVTINPVENPLVSLGTFGEGWHNYHHTFPQDYKAAEEPYTLNPTTFTIDMFAKIGWAYDLKSVSPETIKARKMRTGCESEFAHPHHH